MWINGLTPNVLWWLQLTFVSYFYTQISAPALETNSLEIHPSTVKSNLGHTLSFQRMLTHPQWCQLAPSP